ncbi:MAG: DNA methyltransferase [Bacteroidia bacterium]
MAVSIPKKIKPSLLLEKRQEHPEFLCYYGSVYANRLYYGENLDVLSALLQEESVCKKVKLIYIDPPYSTGGIFQTRDLKNAYTDTLIGEEYLAFMRERLVLLQHLLADDGSIYVHLDNKMVFHVKIMLDEIFGSNNFQGMITRKKCKPKNYTKKTYGNISDYILFYTKSDLTTWNRPYQEWTDEKMLKEYPFVEEGTNRRYKKVPIHVPGTRNGETGKMWRGMLPPKGKHWQYTPDKLEELDKKGEIYWSSNGNPRRKVYLDTSLGVPVQDIWLDFLDINNQNTKNTGYPTEKNAEMLKQIILASSNAGDIVLDAFAGSGSTLAAASELGRNWIGIDNSEEAMKVIFQRFLTGVEILGDFSTKKEEIAPKLSLFDAPKTKLLSPLIHDFSFWTEKDNEQPFLSLIHQFQYQQNANKTI